MGFASEALPLSGAGTPAKDKEGWAWSLWGLSAGNPSRVRIG